MRLLLLPAAMLVAAGSAHASSLDLSGKVAVVSDYRFRGVSQTGLDPAIQPSITLEHGSGLYANIWASNVRETDGGARAEVDFAAGFAWEHGDASLDMSATYYTYPGDGALDYAEFSVVASYTLGPIEPHVTISYSPPQAATRDETRNKTDNLYVSAGAALEIPGTPVTLSAEIGHERGFFDYAKNGGKWDWQVSAGVQIRNVQFQVGYVDNDVHVREDGEDLARGGVVAQLSLSF